jgi:hypothetical protein
MNEEAFTVIGVLDSGKNHLHVGDCFEDLRCTTSCFDDLTCGRNGVRKLVGQVPNLLGS